MNSEGIKIEPAGVISIDEVMKIANGLKSKAFYMLDKGSRGDHVQVRANDLIEVCQNLLALIDRCSQARAVPVAVLVREIGEDNWFSHKPVRPYSAEYMAIKASPEMDYCEAYAAPPSPAADERVRELEIIADKADAFISLLDKIHDDPRYRSVWEINQIHAGPYTGPKYDVQMAGLRSALAARKADGNGGEG